MVNVVHSSLRQNFGDFATNSYPVFLAWLSKHILSAIQGACRLALFRFPSHDLVFLFL